MEGLDNIVSKRKEVIDIDIDIEVDFEDAFKFYKQGYVIKSCVSGWLWYPVWGDMVAEGEMTTTRKELRGKWIVLKKVNNKVEVKLC